MSIWIIIRNIYIISFLNLFWLFCPSGCTNIKRQAGKYPHLCACVSCSALSLLLQSPQFDAKTQHLLIDVITDLHWNADSSRGLCQDGPRSQWYNSATLSPGTFPPRIWNQSIHHWPLGCCQTGKLLVTLYLCSHLEFGLADGGRFRAKRWGEKLAGFKAHAGWGG